MKRAYYSNTVGNFIKEERKAILGDLAHNNQFALEDLQRNTWEEEIRILKRELGGFETANILFEYTIPRMGSRIDNVLIFRGFVFLLEFKVGERAYDRHTY